MPFYIGLFAAGIALLQQQADLPPLAWAAALLPSVLIAWLVRRQRWFFPLAMPVCCITAGFYYAATRAQGLIVPHHGSKTSSTPEFISAVDPRIMIYPLGYRNRSLIRISTWSSVTCGTAVMFIARIAMARSRYTSGRVKPLK